MVNRDVVRRARIGDIVIDVVENESVVDQVEITSYTVEDGREFADHYAVLPSTISLTGVFGKPGSDKNLAKLKNMLNNGTIIRYVGRNIYNNMLITNITRDHNGDNKFGFSYTINLTEVPIQGAKIVKFKVVSPITKAPSNKTTKKVKPKTNQGRKQVKKSKSKPKKEEKKKVHKKVINRSNSKERIAQYKKAAAEKGMPKNQQ